ncbi:MAG: GIY-YIG nuclease family protein [Ignavibacteriales bacterium]|nr:GIY-YIG nuclease family protein [Ignavibacteriales bacterium]
MFTIYVLRSKVDNHRYIGYTDNIERLLIEHNSGKVKSTKNRKPFELIYSEHFGNKSDAMMREKYFKTHPGRNFLNSIGK